MSYDYYRKNDPQNEEPSLADMTRKAIEVLQQNKNGFVLLVEGGRIGIFEVYKSYNIKQTLSLLKIWLC